MIRWPVIVREGIDLAIYRRLEDMQRHLEADIVRKSQVVAYDAEGRLLKLEADSRFVNAVAAEESPVHSGELLAAMREYLLAVEGPMAEDQACDLSCLIDRCSKYALVDDSLVSVFAKVWRRLTK